MTIARRGDLLSAGNDLIFKRPLGLASASKEHDVLMTANPHAEAAPSLVVGIGAYGEGANALPSVLAALPEHCREAFIVAADLPPEPAASFISQLRDTALLPVIVATDGEPVAPGCIYLQPRRSPVTVVDGCLHLGGLDTGEREERPLDLLLSSLAEGYGPGAIGIVLGADAGDGIL